MEQIIRNIKDFVGATTCRHYAEFSEINAITEKSIAFDRAIAMKDIIRQAQEGIIATSDIDEDLTSQGIESRYALEETNKAMARKEAKAYKRYLDSEWRTPIYIDMQDVDLGNGMILPYKPDAIFVEGRTVEAVIYRAGSPSINQRTGWKEGNKSNMEEWFKLWVCQKIARKYAEENLNLLPGDIFKAEASYYFMKKTTDNKIPYDTNFFSGNGGNIVSMVEDYTFGAPTPATETDLAFQKFIDSCDEGWECGGDSCKYCNAKALCNYQKPPVKLEQKTVKKKAKITPSDAQAAAINFKSGIAKLNATAGSGKTETMTERSKELFKDMMEKESISIVKASSKVLHISFTDAAVGEMKERIAGKCLAENMFLSGDDIHCFTFNAFANNAIGVYFEELGYKKRPGILKADKEMAIIERLVDQNPITGVDPASVEFGGDTGEAIPKAIIYAQRVFEFIKTHRVDVNSSEAFDKIQQMCKEKGIYNSMSDQSIYAMMDLYKKFDDILKEECLVTFADQEPLMFKVLEMHPEYFENLGYEHIVVDEFQDTNEVQVETLKLLTKCSCFKSLMVVGDDSQAIYAFRDTTPEYIINFEKYIGAPVTNLFLSENRRSTPEICDLANKENDLNADKVDKEMIAVRESGKAPVIRGFYDEKSEMEFIRDQIVKKIKEEGVAPDQIAYLDPMKKGLIKMGTLLTEAGIPWVMKNPMNLMENSRVMAALSLADAFYQPEATVLYFNYLVAKYNGELMEVRTKEEINAEIETMKQQFMNFELMSFETQRSIFHNYLEEIRKGTEDELYDYFLSLLYDNEDLPSELEYSRTFKKYGSKMAKKMDQSYEGVVLSTIHSSKGLEWPIVYLSLSNLDSERLHRKSKNIISEIEEKRRLLFVGMTRARDELTVTGKYVAYGPKDDRTFNQFLREVFQISGNEKAYVPIDPMEAIRDAERKEANRKKARERYAAKKSAIAETIAESMKASSSGRQMTEDEKRQYNLLAAGAEQTTIFDLPF